MFGTGSAHEIQNALKRLKNLMQGEGAVSVILSGIDDLWQLTTYDDQIDRRYLKLALDPISSVGNSRLLKGILHTLCGEVGIADIHDEFSILRCGPSLRPFVLSAVIYGARCLPSEKAKIRSAVSNVDQKEKYLIAGAARQERLPSVRRRTFVGPFDSNSPAPNSPTNPSTRSDFQKTSCTRVQVS